MAPISTSFINDKANAAINRERVLQRIAKRHVRHRHYRRRFTIPLDPLVRISDPVNTLYTQVAVLILETLDMMALIKSRAFHRSKLLKYWLIVRWMPIEAFKENSGCTEMENWSCGRSYTAGKSCRLSRDTISVLRSPETTPGNHKILLQDPAVLEKWKDIWQGAIEFRRHDYDLVERRLEYVVKMKRELIVMMENIRRATNHPIGWRDQFTRIGNNFKVQLNRIISSLNLFLAFPCICAFIPNKNALIVEAKPTAHTAATDKSLTTTNHALYCCPSFHGLTAMSWTTIIPVMTFHWFFLALESLVNSVVLLFIYNLLLERLRSMVSSIEHKLNSVTPTKSESTL